MKLKDVLEKLDEFGDCEIDLTEEEIIEILGVKKKSWKPDTKIGYYFIDSDGNILYDCFGTKESLEYRYSVGNCFKTSEEAEFAIEKSKVIAELKRIAEEYNEFEFNWEDEHQSKWYLDYDFKNQEISVYFENTTKYNEIYFSSSDMARKAIKTVGEYRIKKYYFEVKE